MTDSGERNAPANALALDGDPFSGGVAPSVLEGGGEMGALMRSVDWAATPIGAVQTWPQSLRTVLGILLASEQPVFVFWGPEMVQFYNDAYRPILGTEMHPAAMGQLARECWTGIWPIVKPMFDKVFAGGATNIKDGPLFLSRSGFLEECFFDYAFNPIRDETGAVAGIFVVANETTARVIGERRLGLLRDLSLQLAPARNADSVFCSVEQVLAQTASDVPFALVYEVTGTSAKLVANAGLARGMPAAPAELALAQGGSWPLAAVVQSGRQLLVDGLEAIFAPIVATPWPEPVTRALVFPLSQSDGQASAVLVVGLSPRLPPGDDYRSFIQLLARQIAVSLSSARAYEQETQRVADLARLDQAKIAFFSNVSHEFRTPLTLILGSVEDALAQPSASLGGEQLDVVRRNALRLAKLVNTLLDFSRIEADRLKAHYQPTDLGALTSDLASAFRSLFDRAGLTLTVDCPALAEPIFVDREMYEKIVLNLLSNAFKFTLKGGIRVSLDLGDGQVRLVVADTGLGIPEADRAHVFERFHRVEGAKGRSYEGSGIGLALVKQLATLLGGAVSVESQLGEGTRFTVSLPLGSAHVPAERVDAPTSAASSGPAAAAFLDEASAWLRTPAPLRPAAPAWEREPDPAPSRGQSPGAHILLADDNADMREYVRRLLAAQGWDVETVADGDEALAHARLRVPDLVLTDVMMPGLDGFGLLAALRADDRTRAVPVILLSARASEEAAIEGMQHGADDYVVKPFSAKGLVSRVSARLEIARERAERLTREQAIRAEVMQQRQKLQSVFMQAPIAIAIFEGPQLIFELANSNYRALVGGREVLGRPLFDALPELAGQGFDRLLREVMATGVPFIGTKVLANVDRTGTGQLEEGYYNFVYSPRRTAGGVVDGVITCSSDVTEEVVAQRLVETLLEQLKAADRRKDEFLAMLAHELRNPMAAISMALALMERVDSQPDTAKPRATARRQLGNLVRMVDDLLDVSRITSGKVELQLAEVDLAVVVEHALAATRPAIGARRHALSLTVAPENFGLLADAARLEQVVVNLLGNAAKYTESGGVIRVHLEREQLEGRAEAVLTVGDTGRGIPADMLDKIFELFVQVSPTLDRSTGGLGLGLTLVKGLVEMHGGRVTARSEGAGTGSEFVVRLPLATAPSAQVPLSLLPRPQPVAAFKKRRVLIVDDSEDVLDTLKDVLEDFGHEVAVAVDGITGAALILELRPDVSLVDVGLPGIDGYELARRVRAVPGGDALYLVALSGYGGEEVKARSRAAGFDLHLTKPVEIDALASIVSAGNPYPKGDALLTLASE